MADYSPKDSNESERLANAPDERDEQLLDRGRGHKEHVMAAPECETAEGLLAFVRKQAAAEDGYGEWLPFALMEYERNVRDAERARVRTELRRLPEPDSILTPEQTANVLTLPKKTVIALCAQGRLEGAFKAGRRWRIPGRAVRRMAGRA